MNENMKQMVDLLAENTQATIREFAIEGGSMCTIAALAYTEKGQQVDIARLKEANRFLKQKVNLFSQFKGHAKLALLVQMAQAESMEEYFSRVQDIYNMLIADKFIGTTEYYIITAMVILQRDQNLPMTDEQCVEKTKSIYKRMKEQHRWMTGEENMGFAALLAVSGLEEDTIMKEVESCYSYLKDEKKIAASKGLRSLSQVLSLEMDNSREKCDRVVEIYEELRALKKKYGTSYELSALGALTFADADARTLAEEIAETDDYLRTKKGFGISMGSKERLIYASILVMQQHSAVCKGMDTSALTSIIAQVVVEQIVMMIIICSGVMMTTTVH